MKRFAISLLLLVSLVGGANANGYGFRSSFRSYSFSSYRVATAYAPVAFVQPVAVAVAVPYAVPNYYPAPAYASACYTPPPAYASGCNQSYQVPPPRYDAPSCCQPSYSYGQPAQLPAYGYAPPVATPYAASVGYDAYATAFPVATPYFSAYSTTFQRAVFSRRAHIRGGFRGSSFDGFAGGASAVVVNSGRRRSSVTAVNAGGFGGGASVVQVNSRTGLFGRSRTSVTAVNAGGGGGVSVVRARVRR